MQTFIAIASIVAAVQAGGEYHLDAAEGVAPLANINSEGRYKCECTGTCLGAGDPHFVAFNSGSFKWDSRSQSLTMLKYQLQSGQEKPFPSIEFETLDDPKNPDRIYIRSVQLGYWEFDASDCDSTPELSTEITETNAGIKQTVSVRARCVRRYGLSTLDVFVNFGATFRADSPVNFEYFLRQIGARGLCTKTDSHDAAWSDSWAASKSKCACEAAGFWIENAERAIQRGPKWFYENELGEKEFQSTMEVGDNIVAIGVTDIASIDYPNLIDQVTNTSGYAHNWAQRSWRGNPSDDQVEAHNGDRAAAMEAEMVRTNRGLGFVSLLFDHIASAPVSTDANWKRGINDEPSVLFRTDGEFAAVLSPSGYMAQLHFLVWSLHPEDTICVEMTSQAQYDRLIAMRASALEWLHNNGFDRQSVTFGLHMEPSVYRIHMHVLVGKLTTLALGDKSIHNAQRWTPLDLVLESLSKTKIE